MTIKSLLYFEILYPEYMDIINSIMKMKNLEIVNFICSLNTPVSIEGLNQFSGSLSSAIQQTKCDTIILFSITNEFLETIIKISSTTIPVYLILFPLFLNISILEKLVNYSNINLYTCLPLRHLITLWKAYKMLSTDSVYNPLQFIEAKCCVPILKHHNSVYGSPLQYDINLNNYYRLIMFDAIQLLSQRTLMKVQGFSKSFQSESEKNKKNEMYLDDYSVILGYFKWQDSDIKKSSTSISANALLQPRTAFIRINCFGNRQFDKINFKIKVQTGDGFCVIDKNRFFVNGKEIVEDHDMGSGCSENRVSDDESCVSFWSSTLFCQSVERFLRHIEFLRLQGTPRLVDVGTQNEEYFTVAKSSLIGLTQLIQLCKAVRTTEKAMRSCQTCLVE